MEDNLSSDYSSKNSLYSKENVILKQQSNATTRNDNSFIKIISELLTNICEENKNKMNQKTFQLKTFISKKIPAISIQDYIERLLKYGKTFNEIFIIVLIYLDTVCAQNSITLNYYNIHKFILAAFIAAVKFHEDEYYSIGFYAKLGGVSKKDAINLEYEFISLMDFKLFVNQELYNKYCNNLINLEDIDIDDDYDFVVN